MELAEKYHDFNALIRICIDTDDNQRLMHYTTQYEYFAEYLFEWLIRESPFHLDSLVEGRDLSDSIPPPLTCVGTDKRHELLTLPEHLWPKLETFLRTHPDLQWILQFSENRLLAGGLTLADLAEVESENTERRKTMLSIAKLALLATPSQTAKELSAIDHMPRIEQMLSVSHYQDILRKFFPTIV